MVEEHTHKEVIAPAAEPPQGLHPEQVHPLGVPEQRAQHPQERLVNAILIISLVAAVILSPIIAVLAESPITNVVLGMLPLYATIILDMVAIRQHFKPITLWLILVFTHLVGLAVLYFCNMLLIATGALETINVTQAVSTSLLFGVIITAVCFLAGGKILRSAPQRKLVAFKPERIEEYVQSIEDKAKAINFVIGRVYRTSNGGSAKMRERLRIPSEWYNEFNDVKLAEMSERLDKAKVVVRKIRDRLSLYALREREVFSGPELANLHHIARHKGGDETILMVLKTNDSDPVENYYNSAVEFCDRILEELERA